MNDLPREKLCELVSTYGRSIYLEPRRCEGLLRDFCGTHKREIHVLISALNAKIPADLLSNSEPVPGRVVISRLAKRLYQDFGFAEDISLWAVESWALALGVISKEDVAPKREAGVKPPPHIAPHTLDETDNPFAALTETPEEQLRLAVRRALADGELTGPERAELQLLQRRLGLTPEEAWRIYADEAGKAPPVTGIGKAAGSHVYDAKGVCRRCACSREAVEHFGWDCEPPRTNNKPSAATPSAHLKHRFNADGICLRCGTSRSAWGHFGWGCRSY